MCPEVGSDPLPAPVHEINIYSLFLKKNCLVRIALLASGRGKSHFPRGMEEGGGEEERWMEGKGADRNNESGCYEASLDAGWSFGI